MPRHLISDAHEWINEIPTVPIYYLLIQAISAKFAICFLEYIDLVYFSLFFLLFI